MKHAQCPHGDNMTGTTKHTGRRSTYRHGDLRHALLEAGIEQARAGGPDAVVLREATRQVGVAPNAAYRHFASRQDLLQGVRAYALSRVAVAMEAELAKVSADLSAAEAARASLRAVGTGYLKFAHDEPGLFQTAFFGLVEVRPAPAEAGASGLTPFQLLAASLDQLVAAGVLPPERRHGAEFLAWSAVHGLALLVMEGPLHAAPAAQRDALGQRLLEMVEKGL
jgi:AcrR family transcriptional regulator